MALPFSEFPETPLNFQKFMNNPKNNPNLEKPKKTNPNLKSFWAFLSSIFIYISIFYIFNLSPSTLVCTTKFWFLISNTLVLIIAADFTAFTATKGGGDDVHEKHVIQDTSAVSSKGTITFSSSNVVSFKAATVPSNETTLYNVQENEEEKKPHGDVHEEHVIQDTSAVSSKGTITFPSSKVVSFKATAVPSNETISYNVQENEEEKKPREKIINVVKDDDDQRGKKREKCARSNSENAAVMAEVAAEEEGKAVVLHRTMSERHDHEEENNEFSRMSNEELNRRVEEFIRRFNKQIRLQAVRNRHNLEMNAFN